MLKKYLEDPDRCDKLIKHVNGVYADFSRQIVTPNQLFSAINPVMLKKQINDMFSGKHVNTTEDRAVLHVALRTPREVNAYPEVWQILDKIEKFVEENTMKTTVVIGIGGSYLGPLFVHNALKTIFPKTNKRLYFVANVDPIDIDQVLHDVDLEDTLFVVVSKTFTTAETMLNANIAKQAIIKKLGSDAVAQHMVAVSTNAKAVSEFGIDTKNMFEFWDWVGGRFSVWSAVGMLPLSLQYGFSTMLDFLKGGHDMDEHFRTTPFEDNIPAIMGIIACFNVTVLNLTARAILPYSVALQSFVQHVQQLSMESNGKSIDTGEIIFGEPGTNGQHSFYQLLHQGRVIPCDFVGFIKGPTPYENSHKELFYNFLAQPDALAVGDGTEAFPGGRPSTVLLFPEVTPFTLGQLLAIYEHQTAVQGFVWGINSFDQPGVQLGKTLALQAKAGNFITYSTRKMLDVTKSCSSPGQ